MKEKKERKKQNWVIQCDKVFQFSIKTGLCSFISRTNMMKSKYKNRVKKRQYEIEKIILMRQKKIIGKKALNCAHVIAY